MSQILTRVEDNRGSPTNARFGHTRKSTTFTYYTDKYQRLTGLGWLAAIDTERPQISFRIGATEFIAAVVGALRFAQNRGRGLLCASEHLVDVIGSHVDRRRDRKSTRLNSSHVASSYAVFCLNKKS